LGRPGERQPAGPKISWNKPRRRLTPETKPSTRHDRTADESLGDHPIHAGKKERKAMSSNAAPKITVTQAVYGALKGGTEQKAFDVTDKVQDLIDRGTTTFKANNDLFGDPIKTGKHFAMNYTVGSTNFAFACEENQMVEVRTTEPQGRFKVIGASYGAINPNDPTGGARDVTAIVQALLDSSSDTEVTFKATNELFGDPFEGPTKSFGMTYVNKSNPNQREVIANAEDQNVTVK
jgi:hypothetical protein